MCYQLAALPSPRILGYDKKTRYRGSFLLLLPILIEDSQLCRIGLGCYSGDDLEWIRDAYTENPLIDYKIIKIGEQKCKCLGHHPWNEP